MTKKFRFETAMYVRSHGKQPRGAGSWAFYLIRTATREEDGPAIFAPSHLTLSQAKAWLEATIAERMADEVSPSTHHVEVAP